MPEVDFAVLSEWFDWITQNIALPVDLIGNANDFYNITVEMMVEKLTESCSLSKESDECLMPKALLYRGA